MDYKYYFVKNHENVMDAYFSTLDFIIKKTSVITLNSNNENNNEDNFQQYYELATYLLSQSYNLNCNGVEDTFCFQSLSQINSLLDLMIKIFSSNKKPTLSDIHSAPFSEFICWVFHTQNDKNIIKQAIQVNIFIFYIDPSILISANYVISHLSSKDPSIIDLTITFINELFISCKENSINILEDKSIISRILNISRIEGNEILRSNAIKFLSTFLYFAIHDLDIRQYAEQLLIENIVIVSLPLITKSRPSITNNALFLFEVISTEEVILSIALKKGLDNSIIKALECLPIDNMNSLYKIIRNIANFYRLGKVKTKILQNITFFRKTGDLIKSNLDDETFNTVITTIDLLGVKFWTELVKYNVIGSILTMIDSNYNTKKLVCSILLHFYANADINFRREFLIREILQLFIDMLDDDDESFCIELVTNLSSILCNDVDYFLPLYSDLGYDECMSTLSESNDSKLAELAQAEINTYFLQFN